MKKIILPVLIAGLSLTACKKTEEVKTDDAVVISDSTIAEPMETDTAKVADGHTTQNSVDWNGTYSGKLPCASCPGIETKLTLNEDNTYTLEENYLEEKDGKFSEKGKFAFSSDGSFVTLSPEPADKDGLKRVYFITEGAVYQAQKEGDRSSKAEYKLTKN